MSNPSALLLLADDIKLVLLEQKRAKRLNLRQDSQASQNEHILQSLDKLKEGLEALEKEQKRHQADGNDSKASALQSTLATLQKQYIDLTSQFENNTTATPPTLTHTQPPQPKKSVRFSSPSTDLESQTLRQNLFPYRDTPTEDDDSAGYRDHIASTSLTNTQIHDYHRRVLDDQDAQLDALGESIGRQRELSMQIGDELESHVLMLDESDRAVERQAGALTRARRQVMVIWTRFEHGRDNGC
ncbi:hypothetical protein N0V88_000185 [Collariella sp. IMI 366227]|nr:hypothetical protein N0V88_000185 [Collariella sp. IMI 366227]